MDSQIDLFNFIQSSHLLLQIVEEGLPEPNYRKDVCMFDAVYLCGGGTALLKLVSPERIEGSGKDLLRALRNAVDHPLLIVDFSNFKEIEAGSGTGLALFFEQRRRPDRKTRVYGLSPDLKARYGEECFLFIEPEFWAEDEERAIAGVSA